jgi:enamine deaminase RidA (YjgF/YER057c/UK114 family)
MIRHERSKEGSPGRPRASHGLEIEERFGYAQAIRAGAAVYVSGQVARDAEGVPIAEPGLAAKFARAIVNTESALAQLGCAIADLVAVSVHVVAGAESAPGEVDDLCRRHLGAGRPAITLVHAAELNNPEYLVEVSAVALVPVNANEGESVERVNVATGSPLEERLGRSDAVRAGDTVYIAGQPSWRAVGKDFPTQYRDALEQFVDVAGAAGATRDDVVSMHVYVTAMPDAGDWDAVIDLHHELFAAGANRPASTMIGVPRVSVEGAAVEISGVAVVGS